MPRMTFCSGFCVEERETGDVSMNEEASCISLVCAIGNAAVTVQRAVEASERALSEARGLCEEAARLAGRERAIDRER